MTVLLSALAFLVLLTVLILIHEAGHFFAARSAGVVVDEFGFGLPPKAKSLFTWRGTVFTLNWVPFGGFVRLRGENAVREADRRAKGSFCSVSIPRRIIILVAGVFMNLVLAVTLLTYGFSFGKWIPTFVSYEQLEAASQKGLVDVELAVLIQQVVSGEGAAQVGVPPESLLKAVDNVVVANAADVAVLQEGKSQVTYTVLTGNGWQEERIFTVPLEEGVAGVSLVDYPLSISAPRHGVIAGFGLAMRESWVVTKHTVIGIGQLFRSLASTGKVPEGISGIVGIAQLTYASVQDGFAMYLRLVALLSLSLAILNILPFPALDGGRLLFVLVEFIGRRPVNRRFELITNTLGFGFLIFLILIITFYDVIRLFS